MAQVRRPDPIPNPEAKAWHGDGTAPERMWESSTPPHSPSQGPPVEHHAPGGSLLHPHPQKPTHTQDACGPARNPRSPAHTPTPDARPGRTTPKAVFSQVGVSVFVRYFFRFWAWVCRPGVFYWFWGLPNMSAWLMRWLCPVNSMSRPWWTMRSMIEAASLSSAKIVPHLLNSMFVVKMMLLLS